MMGRKPREKRQLTEVDLRRLNIGRRYWPARLNRIHTNPEHEAFLRRYTERIHSVRRQGIGALFYGVNSAGKTYGSALLLKHAVSWGYSGYAIAMADVKDAIIRRQVFEETAVDGEITIEQRLRDVEFLLLDDVGKEYAADSGFVENQLDKLLRHRTRELLPTIITTNLTLGGFRDRYAKSVFEIMKESLRPIEVLGADENGYRNRLAKEVAKGVS